MVICGLVARGNKSALRFVLLSHKSREPWCRLVGINRCNERDFVCIIDKIRTNLLRFEGSGWETGYN